MAEFKQTKHLKLSCFIEKSIQSKNKVKETITLILTEISTTQT